MAVKNFLDDINVDGSLDTSVDVTTPILYLGDTNTELSKGTGDALRIETSTGYIRIGSRNSSWAHLDTDRANFYFNKGASWDGNVLPYTDSNRNLGSGDTRWATIYGVNEVLSGTQTIGTVDALSTSTNLLTLSATNVVEQRTIASLELELQAGVNYWTQNGTDLYYTDGNVGILTNTPDSPLHIDLGTADVRAFAPDAAGFQGVSVIGTNASLKLHGTGNEFTLSALSTGLRIYDVDNTKYRFVLDNDGKVGINTTTPSRMLEIKSTTYPLRLSYDDSNYTDFHVVSDGDLNIQPGGGSLYINKGGVSNSVYVYNGAAYSSLDAHTLNLDKTDLTTGVRFNANGDSYLTGGKLGIGTNAPAYGLIEVKPTPGDNTTGITLYDGSYGTARSWIHTDGSWQMARAGSVSSGISISTNNNVGIGKAPSVKLDVAGTIRSSNAQGYIYTRDDASAIDMSRAGTNYLRASTAGGSLGFVVNGDVYNWSMLIGADGVLNLANIPTGSSSENLLVSSNNGSGEVESRTISSLATDLQAGVNYWTEDSGNVYRASGKVGVGMSDPVTELEVEGTIQVNAASDSYGFRMYTSNGAALKGGMYLSPTDDANLYLIDGAGAVTARVNSDGYSYFNGGNVGINNSNPVVNLTVGDGTTADKIRVYYDDGAYSELAGYGLNMNRAASYIRPTSDNIQALYIGSSSYAWNTIHANYSDNFIFQVEEVEKARFDSGGKLGIGAVPLRMLHVESSDVTNELVFLNASTDVYADVVMADIGGAVRLRQYDGKFQIHTGGAANDVANTGGLVAATFQADQSVVLTNILVGSYAVDDIMTASSTGALRKISTSALETALQSGVNYWTKNSTDLYYTEGLVGIGTSTLSEILNIYKAGNAFIGITGTNVAGIKLDDGVGQAHIGTYGDNTLRIGAQANAATTQLVITSIGSVGIGTSTPASGVKLDVEGIVEGTRFRTSESGTEGFAAYYMGSDSDTGMFHPANNELGFTTAASEAMRIDSSGNVGIGTIAPSDLIEVSGTTGSIKITGTTGASILKLDSSDSEFNIISQTATNRFDIYDVTAAATRLSISGTTGEVTVHSLIASSSDNFIVEESGVLKTRDLSSVTTNSHTQNTDTGINPSVGTGLVYSTAGTLSTVTEPSAPTGLTITEYADRIEVTFSEVSGATRYEVWSSVGDETAYDIIAVVNENQTLPSMTVRDTSYGVSSGTIYYKVYAFNAAGQSSAASGNVTLASQTVLEITDLVAVAESSFISISYNIPADLRMSYVEVYVGTSTTSTVTKPVSPFYTGTNNGCIYAIASGDEDKYFQVWVDAIMN